ncbi:MAG: hypothetical protein ACK5O2_02580 [Microthrixaceae bacterium]
MSTTLDMADDEQLLANPRHTRATDRILEVDYTDALQRIAIVDAAYVGALLRGESAGLARQIDARALALSGVAALAGSRAPAHSYAVVVDEALTAGASPDEIVGVLTGVAPIIGSAALAAAAPALALALGYDTELALEELDGHPGG